MSDANTTIIETGLARMIEQFQGSANLRALASIYLGQIQELEAAAWPLLGERSLDNATGHRLDGIGQIVRQSRSGRNDDDYRLALRAELLVLLSNGLGDELLAIAQAVVQMPVPEHEFLEYFPKGVYIRPVDHAMVSDPVLAGTMLRRAVSAATTMMFVASFYDDSATFTLSSSPSLSQTSSTLGLANDSQTTGGHLAFAY